MKKVMVAIVMLFVMAFSFNPCYADTMGLGGSGGVEKYAGVYVGPISSTLNGVAITGGAVCIEAPKTSYFGDSWKVNVSTVSPVNLSNSRLGNAGLATYQQVGWLMGQFAVNPGDVGEIQFAAWRLIDPAYIASHFTAAGRDIPLEDSYMSMAKAINPLMYDFTSVKIYTALDNHNQEFMSGGATQTPIPGTGFLLLSGFGMMYFVGNRKRNV